MYGLAAIEQANGWAMAGAGACIVLTGLAVLSFLISLLPKLTGSFEKKAVAKVETPEPESGPETPASTTENKEDETAAYTALTEDLGDAFTLIDLHRKAREANLTHPHFSIKRFIESGVLVSVGEEQFSWQSSSE